DEVRNALARNEVEIRRGGPRFSLRPYGDETGCAGVGDGDVDDDRIDAARGDAAAAEHVEIEFAVGAERTLPFEFVVDGELSRSRIEYACRIERDETRAEKQRRHRCARYAVDPDTHENGTGRKAGKRRGS